MMGDSIDGMRTSLDLGTTPPTSEKSATFKLTWAMAMLFSGTCTTLFAKALFETSADGSDYCSVGDDDDKHCEFNKPWFTVLVMKLSMTLCLPIYFWFGWGRNDPDAPNPSLGTIKAVALPASLDLLNTILGNIGLLYVNSSIYQMTRGSVVIFSAVLSVKYLGRTLRSFHYYSILFVLIAVILVGTAGIEQSPDSSNGGLVILGLGFILLAQAVTAVQFIAEENLMNNPKTKLDAVALVGFEGLWGCAMFAVLIPILTFTPPSDEAISIVWHEDFGDTFVQLSNSGTLCYLTAGYFVTILLYNVSANYVTQCLSAVVRSILEACRVMGVWVVDLLLFYCASGALKDIGESWSDWSYLELGGFAILMYGTFAYKALIRIPWVDEEQYYLAELDAQEAAKQEREAAADVGKESLHYNILQGSDSTF